MTTTAKGKSSVVSIEALLGQQGELFKRLLKESLQEVLEAEMTEASAPRKGERTPERLGYRSGYYGRTLVTRVGKLELRVPQDRDGRFSTELFERYQRSEQALVAALAEMYVQGVSTRKVKAITEELCGHTFSASRSARSTSGWTRAWRAFADRPLEEAFPYLILDARYEKVREAGVIRSQAVLIAIGIDWDGRRQVLAVELANRESRSSWRDFLRRLEGARPARRRVRRHRRSCRAEARRSREVLPEAAWQRCYVHFLRNALDHLPRKVDDDCLQELRWLYDRRDLAEAQADLAAWLGKWQAALPEADRLGRGQHRGDADLLPAAAPAPQAPEEHQHARAAQRGDQAPHPCRAHLPQRRAAACGWSGRCASRRTRTGSRRTATSTWICSRSTRRQR